MWQFWQALVLNSGPKPSRAVVVDGAITHGLRKKLLPTLKSRRRVGQRRMATAVLDMAVLASIGVE